MPNRLRAAFRPARRGGNFSGGNIRFKMIFYNYKGHQNGLNPGGQRSAKRAERSGLPWLFASFWPKQKEVCNKNQSNRRFASN